MNVQQLIDFDTNTMMFKLISGTTPDHLNNLFVPVSQIHEHYTRHAMSGFYPYQYNQNHGFRSFVHTRCRLWNSLSEDVQTTDSLELFKQWLHRAYFPILVGSRFCGRPAHTWGICGCWTGIPWGPMIEVATLLWAGMLLWCCAGVSGGAYHCSDSFSTG